MENGTHRPTRRRRRRVWPWVLGGIGVLLILVIADLAWAGVQAADSFSQARDDLRDGGAALEAGQLDEAQNLFGAAGSAGHDAVSALGHPSIGLVGLVPGLSENVDALRRSAKATEFAAAGGTAFAQAADAAGWDGSTIPGFAPGGHIDASIIEAAGPQLQEAATQLGMARDEVAPIDPASLVGPLQDPIAQAKTEIDDRAEQAGIAAGLAKLLPSFLGATSPKNYLLVTMTPSDPRAAGGYPGVAGVLRVDGKQLSLSHLEPTSKIPGVARVPGPADVKKAWGWTGIDRFFWDTAYTPDFPTAAGFMKRIWEAGGGEHVDGVIAGDPAMMAGFLGVVGSVSTPAWPETIDANNVQRIAGADVYRTVDHGESDRWQVGIGEALWAAVLTRPWPMSPMASAVARGATDGHLKIWSADSADETLLTSLGVAGNFTPPAAGSAEVRLNGYSSNRVGFFIDKEVTMQQSTDAEGRPTTTVSVKLTNHAPTSPPSILLGVTKRGLEGPFGTFGTDILVYVPLDAQVTEVSMNGHRRSPFRWQEFGARGLRLPTVVRPGDSRTMTVTYRAPE